MEALRRYLKSLWCHLEALRDNLKALKGTKIAIGRDADTSKSQNVD